MMHLTDPEPERWNQIVASFPNAHVLQTAQWAGVKAAYGWRPFYLIWEGSSSPAAAALVLQREVRPAGLNPGLRVQYVPKGPLLADWSDDGLRRQVLDDLAGFARRQGALLTKIDPDVPLGHGIPGEPDASEDPLGQTLTGDLRRCGWLFSAEQVQFRNTVLVDLEASEEEMLARMKQKTRYNVRLAVRKGVQVRPGGLEDLDLLYRMYAHTSLRDGFVIRPAGYYHQVWSAFIQAGMAEPLVAEVEGEPVAALVLFCFARKAWYLYGMSLDAHREKMPNYLLQWEAMRRAKAAGCRVYDLWGAPDEFTPRDSMWGVYRFKEGLGGRVLRGVGAWDYPARPLMYRLYQQVLPRLLDLLRRRGISQTRREAAA
ncbi:MAG: aminoacyltransferase [Chloroflexi bacterium]|jgi:peptidoglycan pentaglycine glycine transferase (the first glycine)|nr:aminoacyltransferase [Chloroflexota bacterium]